MNGARLPFLLIGSLAACADRSGPPVILHAVSQAGACHIEVEGRAVTQDELLVAVHSWHGRTVRIVGDVNTPYKCIGGTIFTVQQAGVKKVSFSVGSPER